MLCPAMDGINCLDPACVNRCVKLGATRPGEIPPCDRIVGICVFRERLIVATERGVFRQEGERFVPVPFEVSGG